MAGTDLVINIATQFLGKKSFNDAEKATKKLQGSVKSLGRTLGVTFSAAAILAYSKASIRAASADIKSQALLANSLKNVGLAYAAIDVEAFIGKMQKQTGVLDDVLRPAFANLAGVTGSVTKTEKIMGVAFDASSGSGLDYASTIDILSKAYIGNRKGLKELNLGLTNAELNTKTFDELLAIITDRFAGAGAASINTYAGQMDLLAASASNASEIIGTSLINAIDSVTGSDGIAAIGTDIENAAKSLANFIDSVVYLKEQLATIPGAHYFGNVVGFITDVLGGFSPQHAAELLKQAKGPQPFTQPMTLASQDTGRSSIAAAKAAEALAKKRNDAIIASSKKAAKVQSDAAAKKAIADKNSAALSKAAAQFDLNRISIAAALKATYDNDTKLRLLAMQAITDEDGTRALSYLEQLKILQDSTQAAKLAGITTISNAALEALNSQLLKELAAIDATKMSEADKNAAKDAAFAKYNDAITKQGGLAVENQYSERAQIQLTSIAKLAALQGYGAALVTLNTIMVSNELAIAKTQSANDLARYEALKAYITLLGVAYDAARALAAANAAAAISAAAALIPGNSKGIFGGETGFTPLPPPAIISGNGGPFQGASGFTPVSSGGGSSGSTIIVNTGATLGTEDTIVEAVQTALQTLNRRGSNFSYAGAIA